VRAGCGWLGDGAGEPLYNAWNEDTFRRRPGKNGVPVVPLDAMAYRALIQPATKYGLAVLQADAKAFHSKLGFPPTASLAPTLGL
jgi:hypothetical protein